MRYRFTFLTGCAVGFVLGARAGRERYDQLVRMTRKVADNPTVQQAAGAAQAQAAGLARTARGKVADRAPWAAGAARDKVSEKVRGRMPGGRKRAEGAPEADGRSSYHPAPGGAPGQP